MCVSCINMDKWTPITKDELSALIKVQLLECNIKQKELFIKHRVPFEKFKIERNGKIEEVFVVAINNNEALYYEDVEEGFNFSNIDKNKLIKQGYEQDELKHALLHWQL